MRYSIAFLLVLVACDAGGLLVAVGGGTGGAGGAGGLGGGHPDAGPDVTASDGRAQLDALETAEAALHE